MSKTDDHTHLHIIATTLLILFLVLASNGTALSRSWALDNISSTDNPLTRSESDIQTAVRSQKAVSAYFTGIQILPFVFVGQHILYRYVSYRYRLQVEFLP